MSEQHERLVRCFASVFPDLTEGEIQRCDVASLFELDSLAGVTLVTLIDDEFGVNIDLTDLLGMGSFDAISHFLRERKESIIPGQEREAG